MMMLWAAAAFASQDVVVQILDPSGLLQAPPEVELVDAAGTLHRASATDEGRPPDTHREDGTWTARVDQVDGSEVVLAVTDARGRRWTGPFALATGRPTLQAVPTSDGGLRPWLAEGTGGPHGGAVVPVDPTWTDPGAQARRPPPWGLLVWGAGLGLGALLLFWWADPGAVRGPGQTLTRVRLPGANACARFLNGRAALGPLVIAGPVPDGVESAIVLGPGRVDVDDLLLALVGLPGRPQVAVTGVLESAGGQQGEVALLHLADRLPAHLDAFVVTTSGRTTGAA